MKTLTSVLLIIASIAFINNASYAAAPVKNAGNGTIKIFAPIYKSATDCDITYYRTKINGENVLVDDKGRFIKYLCEEDEEMQTKTPVIYKVIMVPVNMLRKLK